MQNLRLKTALLVFGAYSASIVACGAQGETSPGPTRTSSGSGNGGSSSTGGTPGTAGSVGTAGVVGTGGTPGTAGTPATGGTPGTAGTPATGGTPGTAGTFGAGGSGGSATPTTCEATFTVGTDGFVRAPGASGCWRGYAYAGGDTGSTVSPTMYASCGDGCMLRTAGTLGAATEANAYAGVVYIGINIWQDMGVTTPPSMAPSGSALVVNYTKVSGPDLRIQVSDGTTRWCAPLGPSPATIPYTTLNTECWEGGAGTAYAKQPIRDVQLVAPGGATEQPIDITFVSVQET